MTQSGRLTTLVSAPAPPPLADLAAIRQQIEARQQEIARLFCGVDRLLVAIGGLEIERVALDRLLTQQLGTNGKAPGAATPSASRD